MYPNKKLSTQCDILITDTNCPDLFSLDSVSIFPANMVKAVIEVKAKYNSKEFIGAIKKLIKIKKNNDGILTYYFTFLGNFKQTTTPFNQIESIIDKPSTNLMPNGFCFLNKGFINKISYSKHNNDIRYGFQIGFYEDTFHPSKENKDISQIKLVKEKQKNGFYDVKKGKVLLLFLLDLMSKVVGENHFSDYLPSIDLFKPLTAPPILAKRKKHNKKNTADRKKRAR